MLHKYVDGEISESVDVTSLILVFQNVSFSPTDIEFDLDISTIQCPPSRLPVSNGDSLELTQVSSESLSPNNNINLIESKRAKISELEIGLRDLISARDDLKLKTHRSTDEIRQLSSVRTEINRRRSSIRSLKLAIAKIEALSL